MGDGWYFSTTDAIPEPAEVDIDMEEAVDLEERQEADLLAPKRRRLHGKQAVSTMCFEGEADCIVEEGPSAGGLLKQMHGNLTMGSGGDGNP